MGFKPYYNWNTFNTYIAKHERDVNHWVLNLIITGIPSIPLKADSMDDLLYVLNLIITGIPSILYYYQRLC